jgi:multidrug efflux pump subunit AcrA (membrane-fusion protein)
MIATPKNDGKGFVAKKQIVTTGVAQGDSVEILTGLKAGVQVINAGARSVREDQSIDIKK